MRREAVGWGGMAEEQEGWRWRARCQAEAGGPGEDRRQRQRRRKRWAEMHAERYETGSQRQRPALQVRGPEGGGHRGNRGTDRHFRLEAGPPERGPPGRRQEGSQEERYRDRDTKY